jgi:hypothetical protein
MHSWVCQGCDRDHADIKKKQGTPLGKPRATLGALLVPLSDPELVEHAVQVM